MSFYKGYSSGGGIDWREVLSLGVPVGRIYGIPIRLHILLVLFMVLGLFRSLSSTQDFLIQGIALPLILFGSVLIHELGHCYGAWIVGGRAREIILWPLGGLAVTEGSQRSPQADLLVTALGPATNAIIALALWPVVALLPEPVFGDRMYLWAWILLRVVFDLNLLLFLFNVLMPVLPMDGGRLLRAALALRMPPRKATMLAAKIGLWIAGIGLFVHFFMPEVSRAAGLNFGMFFPLICIMGILSCMQEMATASMGAPIYSAHDSGPWSARPLYYDGPDRWRPFPPLRWLRQAGGFLRSPMSLFRRKPKRPGGARVVDLGGGTARRAAAEPNQPETPRVKYLRELRDLEDLLRDAVRAEDFQRASNLKQRIAQHKAAAPEPTHSGG